MCGERESMRRSIERDEGGEGEDRVKKRESGDVEKERRQRRKWRQSVNRVRCADDVGD